jgi:hypothetical protein
MTCREIKEMLSEYIDGECEKASEVSEHLENCEECKKEYDALLKLREDFKGFVPKSECSLADSVIAEIRRETFPQKKTPFIFRHIGLVASLVVIVTVAILALPKTENTKFNSVSESPEESEKVYAFYSAPEDAVAEEIPLPKAEASPESALEENFLIKKESSSYAVSEPTYDIDIPDISLNISLNISEEELIRIFDEKFDVELIDGGIKTYENKDEVLNFIYENEYEINSSESFFSEKPVVVVTSNK